MSKILLKLRHSRKLKPRTPTKKGSHQECQYELMAVGIHHSTLLVDSDGKHRDYMGEDFIVGQIIKEQEHPILPPEQSSIHSPPAIEPATIATSLTGSSLSSSSPTSVTANDSNVVATKNLLRDPSTNVETSTATTVAAAGSSCGMAIPTPTTSSLSSTSLTNNSGIPQVGRYDVLLGRGLVIQKHPGNIQLAKLIEDHVAVHKMAKDQFEKTCISWKIVNIIKKEYGGRFMEKSYPQPGKVIWVEVDDDLARKKVAYGFRTLNKMQQRKQNQQQQQQNPMQQQQYRVGTKQPRSEPMTMYNTGNGTAKRVRSLW